MASSGSATSVGSNVCVVGTGPIGLAAIKNLREQGLNVTGFTKDDYLGGLWHASGDPSKTTALHQTRLNTSKQVAAFTDYPFPDEYDTFPPANDVDAYLVSYAKHFGLIEHVVFSTEVIAVRRDAADQGWNVTTRNTKTGDEGTRHFDRVVLATGLLNTKHNVELKGQEKFAGELIHSREFKDPAKYKGKRVMVVGVGASGADTLVFLKQAGADKVYMSHRGQFFMLPKFVEGKAFDHAMGFRAMAMMRTLGSYSTKLLCFAMSKGMTSMMFKAFPFLKGHPSASAPREAAAMPYRIPIFSEYLADYLRDGDVEGVQGVKEITGPSSVTLADGTQIDNLDAIIVCSGYGHDFSAIKGGKGDPTDPAFAPDGFERYQKTRFRDQSHEFARLYQGILSEQYPESLAVLGHLLIMVGPPFPTYDLASMALAGVWSGSYPLPTPDEMKRDIDQQYDFIVKAVDKGPMHYTGMRIDSKSTFKWLNDAAGTGVVEYLESWGWKSWKLWLSDFKGYNAIVGGVLSPAIYRLFDTGRGRAVWDGARSHITKVNAQVEEMGQKWKTENSKKNK